MARDKIAIVRKEKDMDREERAVRLATIETQLRALRGEADELQAEELEDLRKGKKGIEAWLGHQFESSSRLTEEFAVFARAYKKHIINLLGNGLSLTVWNRGHFEVSGFVQNEQTGRLAYFSCSDVRHWPDEWYNHILIRTAKHEKDYTGGPNRYWSLDTFSAAVNRLTA